MQAAVARHHRDDVRCVAHNFAGTRLFEQHICPFREAHNQRPQGGKIGRFIVHRPNKTIRRRPLSLAYAIIPNMKIILH